MLASHPSGRGEPPREPAGLNYGITARADARPTGQLATRNPEPGTPARGGEDFLEVGGLVVARGTGRREHRAGCTPRVACCVISAPNCGLRVAHGRDGEPHAGESVSVKRAKRAKRAKILRRSVDSLSWTPLRQLPGECERAFSPHFSPTTAAADVRRRRAHFLPGSVQVTRTPLRLPGSNETLAPIIPAR